MNFRTLLFTVSLIIGVYPHSAWAQLAKSFIDVDNNGVFSEGDFPLSTFAEGDSITFYYGAAKNGYTPRNHKVGLVLAEESASAMKIGKTKLSLLDVRVDGDITVSGNITMPKRTTTTSLVLNSSEGNIRIAPKTVIKANGYAELFARQGEISIGDRSTLSTTGRSFFVEAQNLLLGRDVKAELKRTFYDMFRIQGNNTLVVGSGFKFSGPHHARLSLRTRVGELRSANIKGGSVYIVADENIDIFDSFINQTYRNGGLELRGTSLSNTTVKYKVLYAGPPGL